MEYNSLARPWAVGHGCLWPLQLLLVFPLLLEPLQLGWRGWRRTEEKELRFHWPVHHSTAFPQKVDSGRKGEVSPKPSDRSFFCLVPAGVIMSLVQMFPFLGWWKSLAASVTGLMTGKELISSSRELGALQTHTMLVGLSQALLGWELR